MTRLVHALYLMLAQATHDELVRQVQYLKTENDILWSKLPERITVAPGERARLLKFGKLVGSAIKELISIVHPRTFARWVKEEREKGINQTRQQAVRRAGRQPTVVQIRDLILLFAAENEGWGYTRIKGELMKLGFVNVGRTTIKNILKAAGFDRDPKHRKSTWDEFVARHASTLWACDFMSVRSLTKAGLCGLYLLVFIHLDSRRIWVSPATAHPDSLWVQQQARNFCIWQAERQLDIMYLIRDRDGKFTDKVDLIIQSMGAEIIRLPPRAPNLNAYCERFIQSLKFECLNHFVVFGEKHLNYLVLEYLIHYHTARPHQGKDNIPLFPTTSSHPGDGKVCCEDRLGGLLKHYYREAA